MAKVIKIYPPKQPKQPKGFNWKILCGCWYDGGGWFRFGQKGYGLSLTSAGPLFSERNGYKKSLKIGFGWRILFVPPTK